MTLKFQCGATCTKGPDPEMLTCENTTPHCISHLEDKPTVGKPACEIYATKMDDYLIALHPQYGRFTKLGSVGNLAKHRLWPILKDSKPHDKHSVHRDKSRNYYLGPRHCVDYSLCTPHKN